MYTLRIFKRERKSTNEKFSMSVSNIEIGPSYVVLRKGIFGDFSNELKKLGVDSNMSNAVAIIYSSDGTAFFIKPDNELLAFDYYIMSDKGEIFEKI